MKQYDNCRSSFKSHFEVWVLAGICLLAVVVHLPLLWGSFIAYDDTRWIVNNPEITKWNWEFFKDLFFTNYKNVNSTPMFITFMLNWKVTPNYAGFAVFNLVWLVLTILMFYKFAGLFLKRKQWRLLACALFSVHCVKADIVAWMSARCHFMGMIFFLGAFVAWQSYRDSLTFRRRLFWYVMVLVCGGLAIINKNIFIAVFPLVFIFDIYTGRRLSLKFVLDKIPLIVGALLTIYLPQRTAGAVERLNLSSLKAKYASIVLTDLNLLMQYVLHLFVPRPTSVAVNVYSVEQPFEVSPDASLMFMRLTPAVSAALLVFLVGFTVFVWRRYKCGLPFFAVCGSLVALVPVLNFMPFWTDFAFRFDWIPLTLFCVSSVSLFAVLWDRLSKGSRTVAAIVCVLYLMWHGVQSYVQCSYWNTNEKYWESCISNYPDATICSTKLGVPALIANRPKDTIKYYGIVDEMVTERKVKRRQVSGQMLGKAYEKLGNFSQAVFYYERSLLRDGINKKTRRQIKKKLVKLRLKKNAKSEKGRSS
ncbi:MAG: hypothetical protein GY854_32380 [Deltaproteobacteria bacterium]|nr:hypothetical protein [Deltaproteobacteria bacterium]